MFVYAYLLFEHSTEPLWDLIFIYGKVRGLGNQVVESIMWRLPILGKVFE